MDFAMGQYSFAFHPEKEFEFCPQHFCRCLLKVFPCPEDVFHRLVCPCLPEVPDNSVELNELMWGLSALFSNKLGTAKGTVCHLDLMDSTPVWS
jgi:hypothetical protein